MSRSLNKVQLIGNVGADPEVRTTGSGTKVANFSIATSKKFTDRAGQSQEKTEWHRITAWEKTADIVEQYIRKGDRLFVEGELEYSEGQDQNGNTRYYTNINCRNLIMLGGLSGSSGGTAPQQRRQEAPKQSRGRQLPPEPGPFDADEDDLPF